MKKFILVLLLLSCNKSNTLNILKNTAKLIDSKKYKIFFIGDSMTSDDVGNISMDGISASKSYGWYLKQYYKDSSNYLFRNHAISGVGISQMQQQALQIISEKDTTAINIVVILGCINNISFSGMTGFECYNQITNLHTQLRNSGFKTIGINLTSRRQLAYFTESQSQYFWTQIQQANALFKANNFSDRFVNLQADLLRDSSGVKIGFAGYEAATESRYFLDGCHFSDLGKQKIAEKLHEIIKN